MICKSKKLKSTFIEVSLPKKNNLIIEFICRHPCIDVCTFKDKMVQKTTKEANKTVVLLGGFYIDFLNFDTSAHINTQNGRGSNL